MNDLLRHHPDMVEKYLGALELAGEKLLAQASWSAEATCCSCISPKVECL